MYIAVSDKKHAVAVVAALSCCVSELRCGSIMLVYDTPS
jgi:hypothetical protein